MLHPSMSYRAGWSYVIHGWLDFIHLRHWAALSKPHCAYTQKLGAPVRSTLLYDFGMQVQEFELSTIDSFLTEEVTMKLKLVAKDLVLALRTFFEIIGHRQH